MSYKWAPKYPEAGDARIELKNEGLPTYVNEGKPGVMISEYPLDNPACFIVNQELIYFRINWKLWTSVNCSNLDEVKLLTNSPVCQIFYTVGNTTSTQSAPVYHIKELPAKLFAKGKKKDRNIEREARRAACIEKINEIEKEAKLGICVYRDVKLWDTVIPLAIATDKCVLLLDFILPDDIGSEDEIIKKLRTCFDNLNEGEKGKTKIYMGIVGDEVIIEYLNFCTENEKMTDILFIINEVAELRKTLISLFK